MGVVTMPVPESFLPMMPDFLTEIAKEISHGPDPLVERICVAILQDLDALCAFCKRKGAKKARDMRMSRVIWCGWSGGDGFEGNYFGYSFGEFGLNLGFLETAVVNALNTKFESMRAKPRMRPQLSSVSILNDVAGSGEWFYPTERGVYMLTHGRSWQLQKRVE